MIAIKIYDTPTGPQIEVVADGYDHEGKAISVADLPAQASAAYLDARARLAAEYSRTVSEPDPS